MNRRTPFALSALLALLVLVPWLASQARADTPAHQQVTLVDFPVTGGASVCTSSLSVFYGDSAPAQAFRITVQIKEGETDSKLRWKVTRGSVTMEGPLNSDTALAAGSWYTFTVGVADKDVSGTSLTYNLEFETTTVIGFLDIQQVRIP